MRWWVVLILTCCFGLAAAQPYTVQDRLGKSNYELVNMGHDGWVKWYCAPDRAGDAGRLQAERIYGYELGLRVIEINKSRPAAETKFIEDVMLLFATTCKSAFTIEHARNGSWEGSSLLVAEASTFVNESIWGLLGKPDSQKRVDFETLYSAHRRGKLIGTRTVYDANPEYVQREYNAFGSLIKKIEKTFQARPVAERQIAWDFAYSMLKTATTLRP